jgi:hypothetical protein
MMTVATKKIQVTSIYGTEIGYISASQDKSSIGMTIDASYAADFKIDRSFGTFKVGMDTRTGQDYFF